MSDENKGYKMETNELITRYVYDVTRRLPENERDDVRRELEASVSDMLPENPGGQDIADVLTKLGAPAKMAEKYRRRQRYLISPAVFELYISVLKSVAAVAACILGCFGALSALFTGSGAAGEPFAAIAGSPLAEKIGAMIQGAIEGAFEGALQAAFWVTVGFSIADYSNAKKEKQWKINDLPRLSRQSRLSGMNGEVVKRSSSVAGMILSVFFTILFVTAVSGGGEYITFAWRGSQAISPFSQASLERAVPYIILVGSAGFVLNAVKCLRPRWNLPLCAVNAANNALWASVLIYVINWPNLWSADFYMFMKTITVENNVYNLFISGGAVAFFSAVIIIAATVDTVIAFHKAGVNRRIRATLGN